MDTRKDPSSDTKLVARHAIATFNSPPSVWQFACEREGLSIDIGGCANRPTEGVTSYSTIGLCEHGVALTSDAATRLELVAVCAADRTLFPNILAAAALGLIRQKRSVQPGDAIRDLITEFYPRATVSHLYLTRPFLWGDRLDVLECETKKVGWLLAVPVNGGELSFLAKQGDDGLERLFRERRIDMYNLGRAVWAE